jgi:hypothetical protein
MNATFAMSWTLIDSMREEKVAGRRSREAKPGREVREHKHCGAKSNLPRSLTLVVAVQMPRARGQRSIELNYEAAKEKV